MQGCRLFSVLLDLISCVAAVARLLILYMYSSPVLEVEREREFYFPSLEKSESR
jgi:hypothetical protein